MSRAYTLKGGGKPGAVNTTTPTLRQVANRTQLMQNKGSASKYARSRRGYKNVVAVTQMTIGFPNWFVASDFAASISYQELSAGAAITYAAGVEYPAGTFTQVLFNGSATVTCAELSEVFGVVNVTIPADTMYWIHTRMDVPNGFALFTGNGNNAVSPNCNVNSTDWGDKAQASATALTDITMTGVGYTTVLSNGGSNLGPHLIMAMSNKPAVINYGGANDYGESAVVTATYGAVGQVNQSMEKAKIACMCAAVKGDSYELFVANSTRRVAMAQYFQYVVFGGVTVDLANGRSAAAILGYLQAVWTLFMGKRLIQVLPAPVGSGTQGQTVNSAVNAERVALRALLLASQPALYAKYDVGIQLEGTTDSGIWSQTVALTAGGIIPNTAGYQKIVDSGVIDVTLIKPY